MSGRFVLNSHEVSKMGRSIVVEGYVVIKNGDKIIKAKNHFVDAGLRGILSTIIFAYVYPNYTWNLWAHDWHIYLGSDTSTTTTATMTELQSPIGTAPGTPPDTKSIDVKDGSSDGVWEAIFIATWYAGSVPATTLGELALYMRAPANTTFRWVTGNYSPDEVMVSRLSSADGDFSSFIIDDTKPLTVEWHVKFSFT